MQALVPPIAKIIPHTEIRHGDTRVDHYFWLRERDNPDMITYLEAENTYTDAMTAHTADLQATVYDEMVARIKESDVNVPEKRDDYYYYSRTEEGLEYPIYCRKQGSLEADEEILLDQNVLAAGLEYCRIGTYAISPNHQRLAYSVDDNGSETYTLYIKDLNTGALLPDQIPETYYSVVWANDNKTLFYNVINDAKRPYRLYRHVIGTNVANDVLIYEETDQSFFLGARKTRSQAYILLTVSSTTTDEIRILNADDPMSEFQVVHPREHDLEYALDHHDDQFYIVTNDQAKNFRLMVAPVDNPHKSNWQEFIAHRTNVKIDSVSMFQNHMVLWERENGLRTIRIIDLASQDTHYVDFPEPVYTISPGGNPEFNTTTLRFNYVSLVTPDTVFDYDMSSRSREVKKQKEVLGGYDSNQYQSERIFATAPDGKRVPISLVYKKGLQRDGNNPCLMIGYGSYGASYDPYFSSDRLSLLDRGFVAAVAHIRGGGEMGRDWYNDGKMLNKKNTFTDFIACAEYLIAEKYTSNQKLVIQGRSAGGLLMGAVVNMRPDLFQAVVAAVPFVDVINTMLDATIPLTVVEYEQWGNPNEETYYRYMLSYSPYDNVEAKMYPNMLITAGLNDPRVQYWEPAKWTAKLRAMKTDKNVLLLKTEMGVGHGGPSGRYERLKEQAFIYAFIIDMVR